MTSQIEHGDDVMSTMDVLWGVTLDLTGHMIIGGGLFAHGDGSTGLMKVVFCYALPTVVQGFGTNETLHFRTTAFGGGGVTVWGCFSFDCKLDLYVLDGNLTGQKYSDNVLAPRVVPHFDNHALADRPMFMDDNARPHRARIVQQFFYSKRLFRQFHGL